MDNVNDNRIFKTTFKTSTNIHRPRKKTFKFAKTQQSQKTLTTKVALELETIPSTHSLTLLPLEVKQCCMYRVSNMLYRLSLFKNTFG